jgi:hypothetical protein
MVGDCENIINGASKVRYGSNWQLVVNPEQTKLIGIEK